MTETPNSNDQAERLRRLQERRAASGRSNLSPSASAATPPNAPKVKSRRKHPAGTTRILLAGLSVTSFFAVGGAIALANQAPPAAPVAQPASSGVAVTNGAGTTATGTTRTATAAQPGTTTNVVAHTTTRGS